jgi:hypothetical protein
MTEEFKPGQRVCIVGRGTANGVHSHAWTVDRVTPKQIVVSRPAPKSPGERITDRFWRESGRMVGSFEYGGRTIHATCQRAKKGS